jgi:hypothetical protein
MPDEPLLKPVIWVVEVIKDHHGDTFRAVCTP